jgi:hypothetical protein
VLHGLLGGPVQPDAANNSSAPSAPAANDADERDEGEL